MDLAASNHAYPCYEALSIYLGPATRVLVCPTDKIKHPATNFAQLGDENISYFLNLDAMTNGLFILGGDRHLEAQSKPVGVGAFIYTANMALNWTHELHGPAKNGSIGGLSFTDGHVEFTRKDRLNLVFQNQQLTIDHLVVP